MWIGKLRFVVATKDVRHAGTNTPVEAIVLKDDVAIVTCKLDRSGINDLQRGATDTFTYDLPRVNDKTPQLPPSVLEFPMPYPASGLEFSAGMPGHFKIQLRARGDDLWIKDRFDLFIKQQRFVDQDWALDSQWSGIGTWGQDVRMSKDFFEGSERWTMAV